MLADRQTREDGSPQHWMTTYRPAPTRQAMLGNTPSIMTRRRLVGTGLGVATVGAIGAAILANRAEPQDGTSGDGETLATPDAQTRDQ